MERLERLDKHPHPQEVMLPHRSDGVGYALRKTFAPIADNSEKFVELLGTIDRLTVTPGRYD